MLRKRRSASSISFARCLTCPTDETSASYSTVGSAFAATDSEQGNERLDTGRSADGWDDGKQFAARLVWWGVVDTEGLYERVFFS